MNQHLVMPFTPRQTPSLRAIVKEILNLSGKIASFTYRLNSLIVVGRPHKAITLILKASERQEAEERGEKERKAGAEWADQHWLD